MTNLVGTTFIAGMWYKSNYNSFFFRYLRDRVPNGIMISGRYYGTRGVLEIGEEIKSSNLEYINNTDYLDNAVPATQQELISIGVISIPVINNSYSLF